MPTFITRCGPRPSRQVVQELVRIECGDTSGLELQCSTPARRRVTDPNGVSIHGWHITAAITASSRHGLVKIRVQERRYIIYKRKHGFAIVAHAIDHRHGPGSTQIIWQRRNLVAIDRQLALIHGQRKMRRQLDKQRRKIEEQEQWIARQRERELERKRKRQEDRERERRQRRLEHQAKRQQQKGEGKLAERSREWKIMTKRPTPEERKAADYGPRPKHARQIIRIYLAKILNDGDKTDIKIYEPSKTWGRVQGSSQVSWGWSVRVRVRVKKQGDRPQAHYYYLMFRGEEIVSTTRVGLGYRLMAAKPAK